MRMQRASKVPPYGPNNFTQLTVGDSDWLHLTSRRPRDCYEALLMIEMATYMATPMKAENRIANTGVV